MRVLAWAIVLAFCWGIYTFGSQWRNPWAGAVSPVLGQLPKLPDGCSHAKGCL